MSGLAPAHRSGPGGPTDGLDRRAAARRRAGDAIPGGEHSTRTRILIWDIELAGSAANYTGEPEFCPR